MPVWTKVIDLLKVSSEGNDAECTDCKFNPCFQKNLAVEFQIMVFQLANKILHLAPS